MKDTEIYNLLESITDDQAFDSDIGGDSDAEDNLRSVTPVPPN